MDIRQIKQKLMICYVLFAHTHKYLWSLLFLFENAILIVLLYIFRKSDSVMFPDNIAKTAPNLIKFILHYANFSLQVDAAVNLCSSQCIKTNRARILSRIQNLTKVVSSLERRAKALATQTPLNGDHKNYLNMSRKALQQALNVKNFKLRKAEMLNHYMQRNWKQLNKKMLLDLIDGNKEI